MGVRAAIFGGIVVAVFMLLYYKLGGLIADIALVLNASFALRGWVRAAVLIPWAIPTIVSAQMWGWILNDQFGLLNDVLLRLGLIAEPLPLFGTDLAIVIGLVYLYFRSERPLQPDAA